MQISRSRSIPHWSEKYWTRLNPANLKSPLKHSIPENPGFLSMLETALIPRILHRRQWGTGVRGSNMSIRYFCNRAPSHSLRKQGRFRCRFVLWRRFVPKRVGSK